MNLKNKTAFIISVLFTIIFAISATVIYLLFADFRKVEFESRLKEKAITSIKLLVEVEQIDKQLLKVIDQNSINKLYDEKTLIFDADYNLIYSSLDDTKIKWTINDLKNLKQKKTFFRKEKENEVYGFFHDTNDKDYYALISANDNFGKRKLEYLIYILISTYLILTSITWLLIYRIVKKLLHPLDEFLTKIKRISEDNLETRIAVNVKINEIDLLAIEFNSMLERINKSYKKQQEFTSNASHELRTPLARLTAQLENRIIEEKLKEFDSTFNLSILSEIKQLSELTNSLLILSRMDSEIFFQPEYCRLDELIFEAFEKTHKLYPDLKMDFNIDDNFDLDIKGNKNLLEIAFFNLTKNAYLYSKSKTIIINVIKKNNSISVTISNDGITLTTEEQIKLFEPFSRGKNSKDISGLGLGLRIVKRILTQQKATIEYSISEQNMNVFTISFN